MKRDKDLNKLISQMDKEMIKVVTKINFGSMLLNVKIIVYLTI